MNELLFHQLPLMIMLLNCLSPYWVIWSGTFYINEIITIPIKLNMFWGIYHVELQSDILGKSHLSMTVPDFIQFVTDNFGIEILTNTTLPLYYTVYVLYIFCVIFQVFMIGLGVRNMNRQLDKDFIQYYYLYYLHIFRNILSAFIIWCLFSYYSTDSLCLNNYMKPNNGTNMNMNSYFQLFTLETNSDMSITDMSSKTSNGMGDDIVCSYSWNAITIVGNELLIFLFSIYVYCKCCWKSRDRTHSGDSDTLTLSFDDDYTSQLHGYRRNRVDTRNSINSRTSVLSFDRRSRQNTGELHLPILESVASSF